MEGPKKIEALISQGAVHILRMTDDSGTWYAVLNNGDETEFKTLIEASEYFNSLVREDK